MAPTPTVIVVAIERDPAQKKGSAAQWFGHLLWDSGIPGIVLTTAWISSWLPWFNFSAALVNGQLVYHWPVGILNSCSVVFHWPWKTPKGVAQLRMHVCSLWIAFDCIAVRLVFCLAHHFICTREVNASIKFWIFSISYLPKNSLGWLFKRSLT